MRFVYGGSVVNRSISALRICEAADTTECGKHSLGRALKESTLVGQSQRAAAPEPLIIIAESIRGVSSVLRSRKTFRGAVRAPVECDSCTSWLCVRHHGSAGGVCRRDGSIRGRAFTLFSTQPFQHTQHPSLTDPPIAQPSPPWGRARRAGCRRRGAR